MTSKDYKRLGDYIRQVDVRNREMKVTKLLGVSMTKQFRPSTSNIVGVDLSKYKIVHKNVFAFDTMSVIRVHKVPIAINTENEPIIVSPAYITFECIDQNKLNPQYLMMWFQRKEFDRYADFKSDAAVRGGYDWEELCDTYIMLPPIERQQEIVAEYETLTRRIRLNEQMISKLEETAQAIYRKMFVDGIDKENLPEGWRMGTIGEYCKEIKSGGTPNRNHTEYWNKKDYPWLKTGEVQNNVIVKVEEYISADGMKNSSAKLIPRGSVIMAMYGGGTVSNVGYLDCDTTTNQACCNMICYEKEDSAFLYFHLRHEQENIKRLANGGAQENLSQDLIAKQPILLFDDNDKKQMFVVILNQMINFYKEIDKLKDLQSLLLAKMGQ